VVILIYDVVKVLADKDRAAKRLEVYGTTPGVGHDIYPYLESHPTSISFDICKCVLGTGYLRTGRPPLLRVIMRASFTRMSG
jgi:hypothetical protein